MMVLSPLLGGRLKHLRAPCTTPFPGLDNPGCPRLTGGQGELQLLLAHGDVGVERGGHASVPSRHAVRMWAAKHPEPEAGKLPGVDSNKHQSAVIHPGERPLVGNCSFSSRTAMFLSQIAVSPCLEQDNPFPVQRAMGEWRNLAQSARDIKVSELCNS